MKKIKLIIFILISQLGYAQSDLEQFYTQALEAHKNGNHAAFYNLIKKAHEIHPYHQGILYQVGIAAALNNKSIEAIKYLKEAIHIQADFNLAIPELNILKGLPAFENLKSLRKEMLKPFITSDTAFLLKDRSLHLESIASDGSGNFYFGSIHKRKILKIDKDGIITDFTKEAQDGLCAVFAIEIDARKKVLWASSSPAPEMINFNALSLPCVLQYDLVSGKLLKKYYPENPSLDLLLGDLTLSNKGDVFVSDSKNNLIFKVNPSSGKLEQFFSSSDFWNIQGITFSKNDKSLYIADYIKGIWKLDVTSMHLTPLLSSIDLSLKSIDGILYHKNTLIAIQNNIIPMRVTQYLLNESEDAITSYRILDRGHPAFNEPTQGCIYNDMLYYIANSQWKGYDEKHQMKPVDKLQDIVILQAPLGK